ncbi:CHAD domain-containing protein [Devosia sediminis]|uniref:CHAD domain-containing protein n=1 Tax=Devosia sediminis TaxID=2798801 RepID=A0A934MKW8_9HYPH|nr:CHAD domain-containing protein [Devosia sediminis]MBJ3784036.1 CHAD domain-containing protein [Devosia sediminis]
MGYAFSKASGVADQVREIAAEQIDKALDLARAADDFDETVHSLRKHCKKLRALLKLVRPAFDTYGDENAAIRSIAEQFSVARDAAVMVETITGLLGPETNTAEQHVRTRLEERAGHLRSQVGEAALLENTIKQFDALRERVNDWKFSASGEDIVLPGLKVSYSRFRKDYDLARHDPAGEVMHEWRKAAKAHWYHMRLFEKAAPGVLAAPIKELDRLGENLGDHHNLTVLADWIGAGASAGDEGLDTLRKTIARRQGKLADESFAMARQFIVEKPSALIDRFRGYWKLLE